MSACPWRRMRGPTIRSPERNLIGRAGPRASEPFRSCSSAILTPLKLRRRRCSPSRSPAGRRRARREAGGRVGRVAERARGEIERAPACRRHSPNQSARSRHRAESAKRRPQLVAHVGGARTLKRRRRAVRRQRRTLGRPPRRRNRRRRADVHHRVRRSRRCRHRGAVRRDRSGAESGATRRRSAPARVPPATSVAPSRDQATLLEIAVRHVAARPPRRSAPGSWRRGSRLSAYRRSRPPSAGRRVDRDRHRAACPPGARVWRSGGDPVHSGATVRRGCSRSGNRPARRPGHRHRRHNRDRRTTSLPDRQSRRECRLAAQADRHASAVGGEGDAVITFGNAPTRRIEPESRSTSERLCDPSFHRRRPIRPPRGDGRPAKARPHRPCHRRPARSAGGSCAPACPSGSDHSRTVLSSDAVAIRGRRRRPRCARSAPYASRSRSAGHGGWSGQALTAASSAALGAPSIAPL